MDKYITDEHSRWKSQNLIDPDLRCELEEIAGDETEISDRFYRDLEFGTGGLRGVIGVGTNRMNIYTVGKATQGYANYLNKNHAAPSVAIAYDSRIKSDVFARYAAGVFAANGIQVHIYRELMPTPSLSFAVRRLGCSGGIVITASHNPAKYNGYKVYGADGCQITTEAAGKIQEEINQVNVFADVRCLDFEAAVSDKTIQYIEEETVDAFLADVSAQKLCGNDQALDKSVSIVYTPLNGAGLKCVTRSLRENGFTNLTLVEEQADPDGNFPTCPYPNPEIREAMQLGIEYAKKAGSDLLLATDPDCDRVGTAVKSGDGYRLISGNEMGLLLFDYICKRRTELSQMPDRPVLVKTIVTTELVKRIAAHYGVEVVDVLTGFKFIGEQIGLLEAQGEKERYIFGFEESYGYLPGTYVRDKDGVGASLLICEMFAYYKARKKGLLEVLEELYASYGYCKNTLKSYTFEGASGFEKMKAIMDAFRKEPPTEIAAQKVLVIYDYEKSVRRNADGQETTFNLPKSNVLKFELESGSTVVVRPSGTEPKLKVYLSVNGEDEKLAKTIENQIMTEMEKYLK